MIPYVSLFLVLIGTALISCAPLGADDSHTDDHGIEMEEMKSNITALWTEVNKLKEFAHTHDVESAMDQHHRHHHHHDAHGNSAHSHHDDDHHHDSHEHLSSDHHHDHHYNNSDGTDHHDHGNHTHSHDDDSHERDHHHHEAHSHNDDNHTHNHDHDHDHNHSEGENAIESNQNSQIHHHHHPHVGQSPSHHHGSHAHGSHNHDSHEHGTHKHGSQAHGAHNHGSHEHGTHNHGSHVHGSQNYGSHEHGTHKHGSDSHKSKKNSNENSDENSGENSGEKRSSSLRRELISPVSGPGMRLDLTKLGSNKPREIVRVAYCDAVPNVDVPESKVKGTINIYQEKLNNNSTIYFELNLEGFTTGEDEASRTHGFHIHANAPSSPGHCNTVGSHFNPHQTEHGSLHSTIRHIGDLGNIVVDSEGGLSKYVLTVSSKSIWGASTLVKKAIAIHEGADDLGKGGFPGSRSGGNAGRLLACCAIYSDISGSIRFNG